jgi:hypothetical protein
MDKMGFSGVMILSLRVGTGKESIQLRKTPSLLVEMNSVTFWKWEAKASWKCVYIVFEVLR